nr:sialidase family protein [Ignavibacteria bacterium]
MKKMFLLLPIIIFSFMILTGQKSQDNDVNRLKWNIDPRMTRNYPIGEYAQLPFDNNVNTKFSDSPRTITSEGDSYTISPNFMVHPSFNAQSETPITRHPTNANIMYASANTFGGGTSYTVGTYVTTNGGVNWFGSDTMSSGTFNYGDPAPVIDKNGRFIISYISLTGAMGVSYSTNNGINFSPTYQIPGSSPQSDKNFSASDDVPTSPYYGRIYTVYTEFQGTFYQRIVGSYSTDGGATWSNVAPVSPDYSGQHFHQGADIKVAPNGDVVVVWANNLSSNPATEDSLGFARSTDGGVSWAIAKNNADNMNGIRTDNLQPFGIRTAGFPRLDIDKTTGQKRGWIYAVTAEKFVAPATDQADIILHRSTDGGLSWTSSRVNQDPPGNGKLQYMPAVNVDEQGGVNVIYYDTRNSSLNDSAQIYVSRSLDGGNSWVDILVSDHKFRPKSIGGLAFGYQGDYIGITSGNGKLWPYWCEDISGLYQAWTASISI